MNRTSVSANTSLYLEPELRVHDTRETEAVLQQGITNIFTLGTYRSIFVVPLCGIWCEIANVARTTYPTLGAHSIGLPQ